MDVARGVWEPVAEISGDVEPPEADILGLIPGKEYKFRVKAVNEEGESEPLMSDKPVLAKDPWGEPSAFFSLY